MPQAPAPQPTVYVPQPSGNKLFSKRNIILIFFLLVVVIALPVGVYLTQKTQILKSRADIPNFGFLETPNLNCSNTGNGKECTTSQIGRVTITVKAPPDDQFPSSGVTPTPTPTPAASAASAPTPTPTSTTNPTPVSAPAVTLTPTPTASAKPAVTTSTASSCSKDGDKFKLSLQWQPVDNADSYKLYVKESAASNISTYTILRPDFGYTVSGLPTGTYLWQVRACNGENNCGDIKDGQQTECK